MPDLAQVNRAESSAVEALRVNLPEAEKLGSDVDFGGRVAVIANPCEGVAFAEGGAAQEDGLHQVVPHLCLLRENKMSSSSEALSEVTWNERLEEYFVEQGEQAHGLSLLHKQAEALYSYRKTFIEIPVIVISSVTGFLSVGSTSMFAGQEMASSISLGILSLLVSVFQTVGTYFGWARRAEGHRLSSIQYARLHRFLKIEMSLPRDQRQTPGELLKYVRDATDRLQEISPLVPQLVIAAYKSAYGKVTDISHPPETNGLEKIEVFIENPMRLARQETLGVATPTSAPPEQP